MLCVPNVPVLQGRVGSLNHRHRRHRRHHLHRHHRRHRRRHLHHQARLAIRVLPLSVRWSNVGPVRRMCVLGVVPRAGVTQILGSGLTRGRVRRAAITHTAEVACVLVDVNDSSATAVHLVMRHVNVHLTYMYTDQRRVHRGHRQRSRAGPARWLGEGVLPPGGI